jgi:hypothetical protein
MNILCGKNAEFLNVKAGGSYTALCFKMLTLTTRRTERFAGNTRPVGRTLPPLVKNLYTSVSTKKPNRFIQMSGIYLHKRLYNRHILCIII